MAGSQENEHKNTQRLGVNNGSMTMSYYSL